jgi:hypothetical protein
MLPPAASGRGLASALLLLTAIALLPACDILKGAEQPPPEFTMGELLTWDAYKLKSTFGTPSFIVRDRRGEALYWEGGSEEPTQVLEPDEFARQFPVSGDPRLTPFDLITITGRNGILSLYVRRSYEDPAQRVGFLGKRITALRRIDIGNHLGEPDSKGWCGVSRSEERYDWEFERGEGPFPDFSSRYILQVTFDGDSSIVSSVLVSIAED